MASQSCCGPNGPCSIGIISWNLTYIFHTHMWPILHTSNIVHACSLALVDMGKIACKLGHLVSVDDVTFKTTCVRTIIVIKYAIRLIHWWQSVTSLVCLLGPLKCFNLLKVDTYFLGPSVDAPLSWRVSGIAGQMNTLSDPPLCVDHRNADYYVIVCRFRVDMVSLR